MRTDGWVGPAIGFAVCLLILLLFVPMTAGLLHTLLFVIFAIGCVVCAILVVAAFIKAR
jgi:hypothetical protein